MKRKQVETHKTTCSYCGVGCGIKVQVDYKNNIDLQGDEEHPVNKGMLCSKGRNLHYTVQDKSDRLLYPQMRWSKNHPLQRVDWDTAINRLSAVFKSLIEKYGPDSVGYYVSGQCLTEEYYLVNKIAKGFIGTNNIDTNSRLCMSSAVAAYVKMLGEDSVPISYDDIELADCFLISGANPAWCHPILYRRLEKHKEENPHVKVIVVDPRKTDTSEQADLHLQVKPGTDVTLYQAIGRCLIESGDIDLKFIKNHTDRFEEYRDQVFETSIEEAAKISDVPIGEIKEAANIISESNGFISMWAMGLNQSTKGVNNNYALINLNLITGQIGKPGAGPFSLTGQPNAMGGREVGGMANLLAAHRIQQNAEHRNEVANFWGVDSLPDKPGLTATQMFDALHEGKLKAVWIICTNPSVSMPDASLVDEAMKKAKFVVVQDISSKSDTVAYADMVLPAAGWLEKEGTMTNSERRISYLPKVLDPPGEALPDSEILIRFAQKMGYDSFDYQNLSEVYDEHCALTKGTNIDISGLNHKRLKEEGTFQWPVPTPDHKGTKRLFTNKEFYTSTQKAQLFPSGNFNLSDSTTEALPLVLTTGRVRDQWHTMTRTGKVSKLKKHIGKPYLEIHPEDAKERNISDKDPVIIYNERGEVKVTAKVSDSIKQGVVFLPMHWGKLLNSSATRANNLTNSAIDPVSKQPGFKFSSVEVKKYKKKKEKIVIVGAGAAAYRFINTYRDLNSEDEIHVFSKEPYPFYNRVLLPEYVNDHKEWEELLKFKYGEFESLKVKLHVSNGIEKLDQATKTIIDSKGKIHTFDKLILATGSRAFIPDNTPMHLPGVFTMRDRHNADDLKAHLEENSNVMIVGGGLLGLELAASLSEINVQVTIIQLASRLMERQLDTLASSLLREQIERLGVKVYTDDQVVEITETDHHKDMYVRLKSGKTLTCQAAVYAIGIKTNIEFAVKAGLSYGRGLTVNEYLQTDNPDIFAIGEIAEYDRKLNGITSAAEQQADIAARFINGDITSTYSGSVLMNILKIADFDLCSIGISEPPNNKEDYEEILFIDKSKSYYKKCLIHKDKLVGAILLGDKSEFAEFKSLIEEETELSEKRLELLRSTSNSEPPIGELVCSCANVGKGNIEKAINEGACSLIETCQATGAGLGCGSCKPEVQRILDASLVVK